MVRSAVTVSLVSQARGGPFVYWDDLEGAIHRAAELGFDAVEIFAPSADSVPRDQLAKWCHAASIGVAAVGTGAGWVVQKLTLTDPDHAVREAAVRYIEQMIDWGADLGAPAIIGSMQGRATSLETRPQTLALLAESLAALSDRAEARSQPLIYEPLNRYETNLCNTLEQGARYLDEFSLNNVVLLADLFHMNIEEVDPVAALKKHSHAVGHVHFVDSNRRAAGYGHLDLQPFARVLEALQYNGYLSAEALPLPDSDSAARQTMASIRALFPSIRK